VRVLHSVLRYHIEVATGAACKDAPLSPMLAKVAACLNCKLLTSKSTWMTDSSLIASCRLLMIHLLMIHLLLWQNVCCAGDSCGACCLYFTLGGIAPLVSGVITCGALIIPLSCGFIVHTHARSAIRKKYSLPVRSAKPAGNTGGNMGLHT
jgi:hypothetical protein